MRQRFQFHRAVKVSLLVLVSLIAGIAVMIGREMYGFRGYGKAEALVPVVWGLSAKMIEWKKEGQPMPRSVDGLLSELPMEERLLLQDRKLRWTPDLDPVFALKVNDRYGFAIGADGHPSWLWLEKQVSALFPQ